MRRYSWLLFAVLAVWMAGDHPTSAQGRQSGPCPSKWRKDPEAAARAREVKQRRMRENGVPDRYLHLLDKMECVACIETAPDTLHITVLYNDDEHAPTLSDGRRDLKVEFKWSAQSERQLREELRNGQIRSFHVWIHEKRCNCCPDFDSKAEDQADWDDDTELNMDEAQHYDDPGDLGPLPDDLKPPPPGSQLPPPPIERFDDLPRPARRVLQATCQPCESLASQWTNESNNLNFLWDRKIEQMRRVSVIANARTNRANEIQRLEYEQRFDSTRTYDNLQQIKELKAVNEAQESDQDAAEREIERLDAEIRDTESRMEDLMQKFLECEKSCKKTATALASPAASVPAVPSPAVAAAPATAPAPPVVPEPQRAAAAAACPDCSAQAQRIGDLQQARAEQQAEVDRHQEGINRNLANINNLTQLRSEAAANGDTARVAELEGRIRDLQNANREHRAEQFKHGEEITAINEQIEAAQRDLSACNSRCAEKGLVPNSGAAGTTGSTSGTAPKRTIAVDPLPPLPDCRECEPLVKQLRAEHERLEKMAQRANDLQMDFDEAEEQRAKVDALRRELEKCKCPTTTTAAAEPIGCVGSACGNEWKACAASNTCPPVDNDCRIPGTTGCSTASAPGAPPLVDIAGTPSTWQVMAGRDTNPLIQNKFTDVFDPANLGNFNPMSTNASAGQGVVIPPAEPPQVRSWLNPLGLLARTLADNIERWRGSVGPRPLLSRRDLELVDAYTGGQAIGLPKGVHLLLTDRGGSTGKTLGLEILNLTGKPVRLAAMPFAIEPLKQEASKQVRQAFTRLSRSSPVRLDLAAYCVEFLKAPPPPNTMFRLAPEAIQKKYEQMSKVLRSAYRVQHAGQLRPDSNPAAYADSIKQWAVWTVEQRLSEARFADAFVGHTRKNVEAAGQPWSRAAEDTIRKVSPNRWRDIVAVLRGAGLAVPQ